MLDSLNYNTLLTNIRKVKQEAEAGKRKRPSTLIESQANKRISIKSSGADLYGTGFIGNACISHCWESESADVSSNNVS